MMDKILAKKDFPQWLKKLESYRVYAPREKGRRLELRSHHRPGRLASGRRHDRRPGQENRFPAEGAFFRIRGTWNENGTEITELLPEDKPGRRLRRAAVRGESGDPDGQGFRRRIRRPLLLEATKRDNPRRPGLRSSLRLPNCFCLSVGGSPHSKEGLDLLLTDLGEAYFAEALTEKRRETHPRGAEAFSEPKPGDKKKAEKIQAESREEDPPRSSSRIENVPAQAQGDVRFIPLGRGIDELHPLRHLHLSLSDLPLFRHQRRSRNSRRRSREKGSGPGTPASFPTSPCTRPDTIRGRTRPRAFAKESIISFNISSKSGKNTNARVAGDAYPSVRWGSISSKSSKR